MARRSDSLRSNAPGELYVDTSCIDCDLCRQLAPDTFARDDAAAQSRVAHQPADEGAFARALLGLVTCPTSSIGIDRARSPIDRTAAVRAAAQAFPRPVLDGIWFCGFASASSYGASSWLVVRPSGNVLVDSPRYNPTLAAALERLGGVRWMFLTHRDDVADHARWHARFGCTRVMHAGDALPGIERVVDGDAALALDGDLTVVPVPGHTRGSQALLYRDVLFSGDHLWADEQGRPEADRDVCWWSWAAQTRSMERLLAYEVAHVLPGHGRPLHRGSAAELRAALARLVEEMHAR